MNDRIVRNNKILEQDKTALLIIDIQERIINVMNSPEVVISNAKKLIQGFKILNLPIYYTEQYPKGLGHTVEEIRNELEGISSIEKMSFSCFGIDSFFYNLKLKNLSQVVICGVESHVCVQQTVLDLLANDFQVNVAADAISSRREIDYKFSVERMNKHGAEIVTTESVLFELLNVSGTEEFKKISKIVK